MNVGVAPLPSSEVEIQTTSTDVTFSKASKVTLGPLAPYEQTTVTLDVQVARKGVAWAENPWVPPIRVAEMRTRKV